MGSVQVSNVQVLGVDDRFWKLAPDFAQTPLGTWSMKKEFRKWGPKILFVNERLNKRLKRAVETDSENGRTQFVFRGCPTVPEKEDE